MLLGNQLTMGIQSKSVRGLGVEPLVGSVRSKASHEPGVLGGGVPVTRNFWDFFFPNCFFLRNLIKYFLAIFFPIFIEFSEMHFDLIASTIFHNIIYDDIMVYFLRIFRSKSTI